MDDHILHKRYIDGLNMELSPLGFGVFRLPVEPEGVFSREVYDLLDYAMEKGINYYDTAWNYLGGYSEELIRKALVERYSRDEYIIADKLPCWLCFSESDFEFFFRSQLERLGVEKIDFYLLHALNIIQWERIKKIDILRFLDRIRNKGLVSKVGFSYHDESKHLGDIVKEYNWDFAQLQINYFDWYTGDISQGYQILENAGIPCLTMETVRGGLLARLPDEAGIAFNRIHPEWTQASWAFKFVSSLDNVAVMLSGMNTKEQIDDNVNRIAKLYRYRERLTENEEEAYKKTVSIIKSRNTNLCTGCNYCRNECPNGIRISYIFLIYNEYLVRGDDARFAEKYADIPYEERAEKCELCKRCEKRCPQYISITDWLLKADNAYKQINLKTLAGKLDPKKKLIVWGAGSNGIQCLKYLEQINCPVYLICDNNRNLWGEYMCGVEIVSPDRITQESKGMEIQIMISIQKNHDDIVKQLTEMGHASLIVDWKI